MSKFLDIKKAVSMIEPNSRLIFSGMQLNRAPIGILFELIRQNFTKEPKFKIVGTPNPFSMDIMLGAGLVSELEFCFMGFRTKKGFFIPKYFKEF